MICMRWTLLSRSGDKREGMTRRACHHNRGGRITAEKRVHNSPTRDSAAAAVGFRSIYAPRATPSRQSMRARRRRERESSRKQLSNISVGDNQSPYRVNLQGHRCIFHGEKRAYQLKDCSSREASKERFDRASFLPRDFSSRMKVPRDKPLLVLLISLFHSIRRERREGRGRFG